MIYNASAFFAVICDICSEQQVTGVVKTPTRGDLSPAAVDELKKLGWSIGGWAHKCPPCALNGFNPTGN